MIQTLIILFSILALVGLVISLIKPSFLNVLLPIRKKFTRKKNFLIFSVILVIALFLFNWVTINKVDSENQAADEQEEQTQDKTTVAIASDDYIMSDPSIQDGIFIPEFTGTPVEETEETIIGCMDQSALNYNPNATLNDNGLCDYGTTTILGCTDPAATNFNSEATEDDGSCEYASDPCEGVVCQNGGSCTAGVCSCLGGYGGTFCETPVSCPAIPCQNGGTCNTGVCECLTGYEGDYCENVI